MPKAIMISDVHYAEMKQIMKTMSIHMSFDTLLGHLIFSGVKQAGSTKLFSKEIRQLMLHTEIKNFIRIIHEMDLMDKEIDENDLFVPISLILKGAWYDLYFLIEQKATMLGELGDELAKIREANEPDKKRKKGKK